jgi:monoamine oxidase
VRSTSSAIRARASSPKAKALADYDGVVYTDFLRSRGASEAWLKLYASDNGTEIQTIGTLWWMGAEVADQKWDKTYHIRGGNDLLPTRLAEKVGMDNILLKRQVTRIEHGDAGVTVTFMNGDTEESLAADYLVSGIPFTTLRNVEVSPPFSDEKTRAIDELFMMNAGRGYIQTKTRFWEEMGVHGLKIAKTDTKIERLWNLSEVIGGDSPKGMIVSYTQDANANAYCGLSPDERESYTLDEVAKFWPQIKDEKVAFYHYCWKEDPWVMGAWCDVLRHAGASAGRAACVGGRRGSDGSGSRATAGTPHRTCSAPVWPRWERREIWTMLVFKTVQGACA